MSVRIVYRRGIDCECGEPGCYVAAPVLLPLDWPSELQHVLRVRLSLLLHRAGGVRSPQDRRRP